MSKKQRKTGPKSFHFDHKILCKKRNADIKKFDSELIINNVNKHLIRMHEMRQIGFEGHLCCDKKQVKSVNKMVKYIYNQYNYSGLGLTIITYIVLLTLYGLSYDDFGFVTPFLHNLTKTYEKSKNKKSNFCGIFGKDHTFMRRRTGNRYIIPALMPGYLCKKWFENMSIIDKLYFEISFGPDNLPIKTRELYKKFRRVNLGLE